MSGRTEWDAVRGIPLAIEAEQWIEARADAPSTTFEHHARSRLSLVERGR